MVVSAAGFYRGGYSEILITGNINVGSNPTAVITCTVHTKASLIPLRSLIVTKIFTFSIQLISTFGFMQINIIVYYIMDSGTLTLEVIIFSSGTLSLILEINHRCRIRNGFVMILPQLYGIHIGIHSLVVYPSGIVCYIDIPFSLKVVYPVIAINRISRIDCCPC